MNEQDLVLNNLHGLISHKTLSTTQMISHHDIWLVWFGLVWSWHLRNYTKGLKLKDSKEPLCPGEEAEQANSDMGQRGDFHQL